MVTTPGKVNEPSRGLDLPIYVLLGVGVGLSLAIWAAMSAAAGELVSKNPISTPILLATGDLRWSTGASIWLAVTIIGFATATYACWYLLRGRSGARRTRVDHAQKHLGGIGEVESLSPSAARAKSQALGVKAIGTAQFTNLLGVPVGRRLGGRQMLHGSWEDMHLDIWGPRQGKSTSRIIPAICEAPGAVLATENKRGNLDATRLVREFRDETGTPTRKVWVFDPQQVANEPATWWWNPLSYVTDETTAEELAQLFAVSEDGEAAKRDPYFDPEGEDLLGNLILASALANEPIGRVYERLVSRDDCFEAVAILDEHNYPMIARALNARLQLADKQQDGIFGTAVKMARCLRTRDVAQWISGDASRPHLDLEAFVRNGETLYALSREGVGSVGPLVGALTMAACKTAERIATASPGGRLETPMLCALDEAANVVRWPDLPKLYSHFGSRGIIIMTILQAWSQGVRVWGEKGMDLLLSASNVFVYGGNVREEAFLEKLSKLVGEYERRAAQVSHGSRGGSGRSVSTSTQKERLLTSADLTSWPRGRALILSAGNRAVIAETVPWMTKPYAGLIQESIREYSPEGQP